MPTPITTYKNDYIDPRALKDNLVGTKQNDNNKPQLPPVAVLSIAEHCGIAPKTKNSEWTGIAPMGALIHPRVIPDSAANVHPLTSGCTDRANRFLANVQNNDPGLYERLKTMNHDDLQMQVAANRLKSTYQVDYGHMAEFNTGPMREEEEHVKAAFLAPIADKCGTGSVLNDVVGGSERGRCKGRGNARRTNICIKHCELAGHWHIANKLRPVSEYADTTSRMGGIILKNNIHEHGKCKPNYCKHPMKI